MASVLKDRWCRQCKKKKLTAFLEIEGAVVVVAKSDSVPFGCSILIHRGIFCNMKCFQQYVLESYIKGNKGRVGQ